MKEIANNLPIIVRVSVVHTNFDPDAIDTEIYCVNNTSNDFYISTKSESFITIDEEIGTTINHGSKQFTHKLAANESVLIANVLGWEWDSYVGIEIYFKQTNNDIIIIKNFNLKESKSDFTISSSGKKGRVIPPLK